MKTLLVLTLLAALVWLGVWNSPKAAHDEGYSVVRTMKLTGEALTISSVIVDEAMVYAPVKAATVPWVKYTGGRVLSNELIAERADMLLQTSAVEIGSPGTTACLVYHPDGQQCEGDGKGGYIAHD